MVVFLCKNMYSLFLRISIFLRNLTNKLLLLYGYSLVLSPESFAGIKALSGDSNQIQLTNRESCGLELVLAPLSNVQHQ